MGKSIANLRAKVVPGTITRATFVVVEAEVATRKTPLARTISKAPKNALQITTAAVEERPVALFALIATLGCDNAEKERKNGLF